MKRLLSTLTLILIGLTLTAQTKKPTGNPSQPFTGYWAAARSYLSSIDSGLIGARRDTTDFIPIVPNIRVIRPQDSVAYTYNGYAWFREDGWDSVSEIRLRRGVPGQRTYSRGYRKAGDEGGGWFYWDKTSTAADDSGTVFSVSGVSTGRWRRDMSGVHSSFIPAAFWGVDQDSTTDDAPYLLACQRWIKKQLGTGSKNLKGGLTYGTILLPAGVILFGGTTPISEDSTETGIARSIRMKGAGVNVTRIKVTGSIYLIDVADAVQSLELSDFELQGGKGLYRNRAKKMSGTGAPNFKKRFHDLALTDYTVCGIASNLDNDPYMDVENVKFRGAAGTIGVMFAPGGGHCMRGCWINGGGTLAAFRGTADTRVFDNRIGSNPNDQAFASRNIFWLIPLTDTLSNDVLGLGLEIFDNYKGNERDNPYDVVLRVALPDTSGNAQHTTNPDWGTYRPLGVKITDQTINVRGLSIYNNTFNADGGQKRGIIYSQCERLMFTWENNQINAPDYPYILEMDSTFSSFSADNKWIQNCTIRMNRQEYSAANNSHLKLCNIPGVGLAFDPHHMLKGMDPVVEFPVAGSYDYQSLPLDTFAVIANASIGVPETGLDGNQSATTLTFTANDGRVSKRMLDLSAARVYKNTWLGFDLHAAADSSIKTLVVEIDSVTSNAWHRWIVPVPSTADGWKTVPLLFNFPKVTGSWIVKFTVLSDDWSNTTKKVTIGRVRLYQSDSRKDTVHYDLLPADIGRSPKTASVSGSDVTTTSTTASDVTGLQIALDANAKYEFDAEIHTGCNNTGGCKFALNGPSGSAILHATISGSSSNNTSIKGQSLPTIGTLNTSSLNAFSGQGTARMHGYFTTSSTSGNATIQVASNTGGETCTVYIGSTFKIQRVQ